MMQSALLSLIRVPKSGALTLNPTWTPKVCKIIAFMVIIMGSGPLLCILLGFR